MNIRHYNILYDHNALKSVRFRPTIIILVNDADGGIAGMGQGATKSIYEYLRVLLLSLDEVFYPGIGFLVCEEHSLDASVYLLETAQSNPTCPTVPTDLAQLLRTTLGRVQSSRLLRRIEQAGYTMPDPSPQIYIVGQAQSGWIATIADQVIAELGKERDRMFLAYLLIDTPKGVNTAGASVLPTSVPGLVPPSLGPAPGGTSPVAAQPLVPLWSWDLLPQADTQPKIDYCFLYEQREGSTRNYVEDTDMRFAIAEALLGLIGTDFTFSPLFLEHIQLPIVPWNLEDRIGSLGTSRGVFPLREIEAYCGNLLGAELMLCQLKKLKRQGTEEGFDKGRRDAVRAGARQDAKDIEHKLGDNDPLPYFPEYGWPSLQFLEDEGAQQQLQIATENIFQHFDASQKMKLTRRAQLGLVALGRWQAVVAQVWSIAGKELQQQFQQKVQALLGDDDSGQLARLYAGCFDDQLNHLRDQFMDLRVKHKDQYDKVVIALRVVSEPWRARARSSVLTPGGPVQATPQAPWAAMNQATASSGPAGGVGGTGTGGQVGGGGAPPASSPSRLVPLPEKDLVESLQQRMDWMETRIPSFVNLFGVGLAVLPALILLVLNLFALSWTGQALLFLMCVGGCGGVFVLCCLLLRQRAQARLRQAEADLFHLYRCHFAYVCEQWEDRRRVFLLGQIIPQIRQIRARLENMVHFTEQLNQILKAEAEHVERELFESAQAYRDVLVGDGNILGHGGNSLSVIDERIHQLRQSAPKEEWHQSHEQLNTQMQRELFDQGINILIIQSAQDLIQPVRNFCTLVLRSYFVEVADLSFLLEPENSQAQRVWQRLLKYSTVLYMPDTLPTEHLVFCARPEQHGALSRLPITHNAQLAGALSRAWMMVIHFSPGGSSSRWAVLPGATDLVPLAPVIPATPNWQRKHP